MGCLTVSKSFFIAALFKGTFEEGFVDAGVDNSCVFKDTAEVGDRVLAEAPSTGHGLPGVGCHVKVWAVEERALVDMRTDQILAVEPAKELGVCPSAELGWLGMEGEKEVPKARVSHRVHDDLMTFLASDLVILKREISVPRGKGK